MNQIGHFKVCGVYVLGGKCLGGKCPGGSDRGVCVLGGKCPGGKCPGGKRPGGMCPWGKCPGGTCPGGFCPVTLEANTLIPRYNPVISYCPYKKCGSGHWKKSNPCFLSSGHCRTPCIRRGFHISWIIIDKRFASVLLTSYKLPTQPAMKEGSTD